MDIEEVKGIRGFILRNTRPSEPITINSSETKILKGINGFIFNNSHSTELLTPALIVNFEERGCLDKMDIYRVSGPERQVRTLRNRLLDEPSPYEWSKTDQSLLCTNKFMETIIPSHLWRNFYEAVKNPFEKDSEKDLIKAIETMPYKNRTTLAFLVLHFKQFADCRDIMMPFQDFAANHNIILTNVNTKYKIMLSLLKIPFEYWFQFVPECNEKQNNQGSFNSSSKRSHIKNATSMKSASKKTAKPDSALYRKFKSLMKNILKLFVNAYKNLTTQKTKK